MGMGGGNEELDKMMQMVQMLEMNTVWMQDLQQHIMQTYNRLREVVVWIVALKDVFLKRETPNALGTVEPQPVEQYFFDNEDAKTEALQRLKRRLKVLLVLFVIFLAFVFRDSRRRRRTFERELQASRVWTKVAGHLPPPAP